MQQTVDKYLDLTDQKPLIHSGDFGTVRSDLLLYMLTRRLGLYLPLRYSVALNRGGWFHRRGEHFFLDGGRAHSLLFPHLRARISEVKSACQMMGKDSKPFVDREQEDYDSAFSWFDAASKVPLNLNPTAVRVADVDLQPGATLLDFFNHPDLVILGTEVEIVISIGEGPCPPLVILIDYLIYNTRTHKLWIGDAKTCAKEPDKRMRACPIEPQTQMYPRVLREAILQGLLEQQFGLPRDTEIGGMIHLIFQKPDIKFCGKDRDAETYEHTLMSGPRKGQIEMRKRWLSDEPRRENYVRRCTDWYLGTGIYTDEAEERVAKPPVNISSTSARWIFNDQNNDWFSVNLFFTAKAATIPLTLGDFPPNADTLLWGSRGDDYEAFYLLAPEYWEDIIRQKFLVGSRDRDVPAPPSIRILGTTPGVKV